MWNTIANPAPLTFSYGHFSFPIKLGAPPSADQRLIVSLFHSMYSYEAVLTFQLVTILLNLRNFVQVIQYKQNYLNIQ